MIIDRKQLAKKLYPKLEKFLGGEKGVNIIEVDFNKTFWKVILDQKIRLIIAFIVESILFAFLTLIPLILVSLINFGRLDLFLYFIIFWVFLNIVPFFHIKQYTTMIAIAMESVYYNAIKYFLTVDPIFHSTKSSGQIIAKVSRASEAFEELIDTLIFDILKIVVGVVTSLIAIFYIDYKISLIGAVSLTAVLIFSSILRVFTTEMTTDEMIQHDDEKKEVGMESLIFNQYIRSSFATNEQDKRVRIKSKKMIGVLNTFWLTDFLVDIISRLLYILSFMFVGGMVFWQIQNQNLNLLLAAGILLAFYQGTKDIWTFGRFLQRFTNRREKIVDLFEFIRNFGKQTYPVLDNQKLKN